MNRLLEEIKGKRIIVAGDVMLDRYWWGSVKRISPEAPVPIVDLERTSVVPGGAANVAVNLAGLGVEPILLGVCGQDDESDVLANGLRDKGVSSSHLHKASDRRTTVKTRIVAHQQHVVRIDQEDAVSMSPEGTGAVLDDLGDLMNEADAVILSDYAKGFLTNEMIAELISRAREKQIPILADPKGRDFIKYKGVSVITPNKREAIEAAGLGPEADTETAGQTLVKARLSDAVLVTEGEHGMTLFEGDIATHLDPVAHEVYDVTGAGDTVISVFAACLSAGSSLIEAAEVANLAAGIVVGHVGTTTITAAELASHQARMAATVRQ